MSRLSTPRSAQLASSELAAAPRRPGPGRPPKPVVEYPEPLWEPVETTEGFASALDLETRLPACSTVTK